MSLIIALLVLTGIIVVHEFGHFIAARAIGVPVAEFGVGLGSALVSITWGGTRYRLNTLPLGGYVTLAMEGDDGLAARPYWAKALVMLAGIGMNFITAIILLTILLTVGGHVTLSDGQSTQAMMVEARPVLEALGTSVRFVIDFSVESIASIPGAILNSIATPDATEIAGPLGIASMTGHSVTAGGMSVLYMAALLSIVIGAFNLLPIPILDGGHFLRYTIEFVIRRPLPETVVKYATLGGLVLLFGLVLFATVLDLMRLF